MKANFAILIGSAVFGLLFAPPVARVSIHMMMVEQFIGGG
jgi:hypothetical protein